MANVTKVTPLKKAEFLTALEQTASVTAAALSTGVSRTEWYRTRDEDPQFAADWVLANDRGTDALEDEAVRRAHEGTLKPVYQGKELVGHIREYSDTLLIFTLKARRPEKYRERTLNEHVVQDLTPEQRQARIDELLAKRQGRNGAAKAPGNGSNGSGGNGVIGKPH